MVPKLFSTIPKFLRLIIAWLIGSAIYFLYAIATVYDGLPSLICQPFMAMGFSAIIVFISLVLGLPLMLLTPHRPQWFANVVAGVSLLCGLSFLLIPEVFSSLFEWLLPEIQAVFSSVVFIPVYLGYFILIFTIVNWPKMNIVKLEIL